MQLGRWVVLVGLALSLGLPSWEASGQEAPTEEGGPEAKLDFAALERSETPPQDLRQKIKDGLDLLQVGDAEGFCKAFVPPHLQEKWGAALAERAAAFKGEKMATVTTLFGKLETLVGYRHPGGRVYVYKKEDLQALDPKVPDNLVFIKIGEGWYIAK